MTKKIILSAAIAAIALISAGTALISKAETEPSRRKIVVFKPKVDEAAQETLISRAGGEKIKDLKIIRGKAVKLTSRAEINLAKEDGVLRIDDDIEIFALAKPSKINAIKPQPAEILPWGINRIDAELVWPGGSTMPINTADPIRVGIIDTGIEINHPDLKDNLKGGMSAVNYTSSYNDDNGHGTHVAGITAAADNTIGVIGVGPNIDLYAIKVLDRRGSGYLSDIIEGLDWAIANRLQVINMSLGTTYNSDSFRDAVKKVNAAGIVQVAAAGNDGKAVNYPAAYPEVIAVTATDNANNLASWSSRGPQVDLAAPGVSIFSTYKGSTYKTLSVTSMAAPHAAGVAALVINTPVGAYDANSDGIWNPSEVQEKLQDRAIDLGAPDFDNLYGHGLVNAYSAVQP